MDVVKVRVISDDQDTQRDTVDLLTRSPCIIVAGPGAEADVVLLVADDVSVFTLWSLGPGISVTRPPRRPAVFLACKRIQRMEMLYAARLGVTAVLGREARDPDRLVGALIDAAHHAAVATPCGSAAPTEVTGGSESADGPLSQREVRVLQLLAEGFDTSAIATKVNYSKRTVKHIIHGVVTRKKLRNRAHAVAFALRSGML